MKTRQQIMNEIKEITGTRHQTMKLHGNSQDRMKMMVQEAETGLAVDMAFARFHFRSLSTLNYA